MTFISKMPSEASRQTCDWEDKNTNRKYELAKLVSQQQACFYKHGGRT